MPQEETASVLGEGAADKLTYCVVLQTHAVRENQPERTSRLTSRLTSSPSCCEGTVLVSVLRRGCGFDALCWFLHILLYTTNNNNKICICN